MGQKGWACPSAASGCIIVSVGASEGHLPGTHRFLGPGLSQGTTASPACCLPLCLFCCLCPGPPRTLQIQSCSPDTHTPITPASTPACTCSFPPLCSILLAPLSSPGLAAVPPGCSLKSWPFKESPAERATLRPGDGRGRWGEGWQAKIAPYQSRRDSETQGEGEGPASWVHAWSGTRQPARPT